MVTELPAMGPKHKEEELHSDDHLDNLRSKLIASGSRHVTLRVAIKHASSWLHVSRIPTSKWRTDCPLMRCAERIIVCLTSVLQKGAGKLMFSREGRCTIKEYQFNRTITSISPIPDHVLRVHCLLLSIFLLLHSINNLTVCFNIILTFQWSPDVPSSV